MTGYVKMNVCLLNDSFPPVIDGVANAVVNYARIMQGYDNTEVVVATPRYPDADYSGYPYRVIPYRSFDTSKLVSGYRAGNSFSVSTIDELSKFAPDIIHTHCPASSAVLARLLQAETGAPIVFTYHTKFDVDISRAVGDGFLKKETLRVMISNISACDEVWTVSGGAGENLRSLGYEGEYRVMLNGVDFAKGKASQEEAREAVKNYDLPDDVPVFLYVGRIMNYKGLPLILDALKILSGENFDFRMLFVGKGADEEGLKNTVEEYGLSDKIFFTGPVYDREVLRAINTRADLFLFPSTYDTNGIVVREAAACGLASVLISGSCAAEGITDGRNGYLIEETPEAMASLLSRICKDMDDVRTCGERAMDEIYISWEDSVKCAYERYGEIREMIMDGRLTRRKPHLSDLIIEQTAEVEEKLARVFETSRNLYEGMMDNVEQAKDSVKKNLKRVENTIRNGVEKGQEFLIGKDGEEDA